MAQPVYFDHAATTPVREEVMEAMLPFFGAAFGNPSSVHRWGREARVALDEARERVAACIGANQDEVSFTSGGTEADNFALLGVFYAVSPSGKSVVVTSPIEHKAVLETAHHIAHQGGSERIVPVNSSAVVEIDSFRSAMSNDVAIASIMWVNNEVGVIQDIPAIAAIAKESGAIFHTDAVQAFGKVEVNAAQTPFDLLTISGHKLGAPKGVGALYIRRKTPLAPLFHGGSQDRGRRPGTENVAYAVGLAKAAELTIAEHESEGRRLGQLRNRFETMLKERIPDLVINAAGAARAPHVSNISIPGTNSESMLMALDLQGIACSAGSACQSGSVSASHVLTAMGVSPSVAGAALRFSFGSLSSEAGVDRTVEVLTSLAQKTRQFAPATPNTNAFAVVDF